MPQSRHLLPVHERDQRHAFRGRRVVTAALLFALAVAAVPGRAPAHPPKREVRAVWIATAAALDWPRSYTRESQELLLRAMVKYLHSMHFNTIYFQVRARGDAFYRSRYEPWSDQLTGTLGLDPGWDPLATLLEEAHAQGLEVHGWFNLFKVRGLEPVRPSIPLHPSLAHPGWCISYENELWMDPGNPAVRSYLITVALDLIRRYPLDGIQFDYIRYPGRDFPDETTYRGFGGGMERDAWRRSAITTFVRAFYDSVRVIRPMLKVGSAPLGVYDRTMHAGYSGSLVWYYQDALGWLQQGVHDYLTPQLYWNLGATRSDPDFAALAAAWASRSGGRPIVTGIAAYKPDVAREIPLQIDAARRAGAAGEAFFRFAFITGPGTFGGRYDTPALIPPMSWKDSLPPLQPPGLGVSEIATNVFGLEWKPSPPAADGDTARAYVVYRSSSDSIDFEDPSTIVAILPSTTTHLLDTVAVPEGFSYTYAVTALDKGNNESLPSMPSRATVAELLELKRKMVDFTSLSTAIPLGSTRPTLAAYRRARRMPITLQIYRKGEGNTETLVSTLIDSIQEGGTYVLGLTDVPFRRGSYVVRLSSGGASLEQAVVIAD